MHVSRPKPLYMPHSSCGLLLRPRSLGLSVLQLPRRPPGDSAQLPVGFPLDGIPLRCRLLCAGLQPAQPLVWRGQQNSEYTPRAFHVKASAVQSCAAQLTRRMYMPSPPATVVLSRRELMLGLPLALRRSIALALGSRCAQPCQLDIPLDLLKDMNSIGCSG